MINYIDAIAAPNKNNGHIKLHGPEGFAGMRKAGQLTARCLDELVPMIEPGLTTQAIDRFVFEFGMDHGAVPATLNYRGYTNSCCTSLNHVVCHGIPSIQRYAEAERCSVVRDFCGHGLGKLFHDVPNILHYGRAHEGVELREGMIFTIEPMINLGKPHVKVLADGWTAVTRDRSLTAQYEHSIGVTADGCEIFTLSPAGLFTPGLGTSER